MMIDQSTTPDRLTVIIEQCNFHDDEISFYCWPDEVYFDPSEWTVAIIRIKLKPKQC